MLRTEKRHLRRWGLLAGLMLLGARPARSEPATTVVLLRTRAGDDGRWRAAEERARDELRMMGLRVTEVVVREDPAEIERAMAEHGARAAIRLERAGEAGAATMWWAEADGARRAARLDGLTTEGRAAAALAALRAAEMVRAEAQARGEARRLEAVPEDRYGPTSADASVLTDSFDGAASIPKDSRLVPARADAGLVPPPPGGAPAQDSPAPRIDPLQVGGGAARRGPIDPLELVEAEPPAAAPRPTPPPRRGAIGLYAGVAGGPGGGGALVGAGLALRGHVTRALAIQGELHGATSPIWLSGQGVLFRAGLAGARAALALVARRDARVAWRFGLGGGVTLAWALARTPDRRESSQDLVIVGAARASVHAAIRAQERLRVVLGVDVDLLAPPVAVRVRGVELARLGAPLFGGVLGLEWDWPRARW